jgi:hypothetical protein
MSVRATAAGVAPADKGRVDELGCRRASPAAAGGV